MRALGWMGMLAGPLALSLAACGGGSAPASQSVASGGTMDQSKWPADDRSLCEGFVHWKGNPDLEFSETAGTGSLRPNIRRIFKLVGDKDDRHEVVMCREVDTNLDGIKDIVRTFNDKGEPQLEQADTNYDGKIDNWVKFVGGRIAEEDVDTTLSAGSPNEWKFYVNGQLSRIRKNTHCPSGKPDEWQIYYKNHMERIGVDSTCDSHIDRWDRDAVLMAQEMGEGVQIVDGGMPAPPSDGGAAEGGGGPTTVVGDDGMVATVGGPDAGGGKAKNKPKKRVP